MKSERIFYIVLFSLNMAALNGNKLCAQTIVDSVFSCDSLMENVYIVIDVGSMDGGSIIVATRMQICDLEQSHRRSKNGKAYIRPEWTIAQLNLIRGGTIHVPIDVYEIFEKLYAHDVDAVIADYFVNNIQKNYTMSDLLKGCLISYLFKHGIFVFDDCETGVLRIYPPLTRE